MLDRARVRVVPERGLMEPECHWHCVLAQSGNSLRPLGVQVARNMLINTVIP